MSIKKILAKMIISHVQHYNHEKYWVRRAEVINPKSKVPKLLRLYYLYYVKKTDAYHNCSFGTLWNQGSTFITPPQLPHGPNGIIIGNNLSFGKNCILFHHVTIASGGAQIGDNVLFSAGCTVLSDVKRIGNNAKIGANTIVIEDVPDNATVVMQKPRVLIRK